jgi:acetoin utilization protein AcuB
MCLRDWMTAPVQVIGPDAPAWEAVARMRRHRIRRLPVVEGEALVGIVTWTDVVRLQPPAHPGQWQVPTLSVGVLVRHLMTPAPRVVDPDDSLEYAASLMRTHKIGGLPVVEGGRVVGIVTESDLFGVFADVLGTRGDEVRLHVPVGSIGVELPRLVAGLARAGVPIVALHSQRVRGIEGIDVVVHERDGRRAREALRRLALEASVAVGAREGR